MRRRSDAHLADSFHLVSALVVPASVVLARICAQAIGAFCFLGKGVRDMKVVHCRDVGFDCDGVVQAETEAEVLQQVAEHAKTVHNLQEISEEIVAKVRSVIRDEQPVS